MIIASSRALHLAYLIPAYQIRTDLEEADLSSSTSHLKIAQVEHKLPKAASWIAEGNDLDDEVPALPSNYVPFKADIAAYTSKSQSPAYTTQSQHPTLPYATAQISGPYGHSRGSRKATDRSTPWSDGWLLHQPSGRYYKYRYNPRGEEEYSWYDENSTTQPNHVPGNADVAAYTSQSQPSSYPNQGDYTTSPSYAATQTSGIYGQASGSAQNYPSLYNTASHSNTGSSQGWTQTLSAGQIFILVTFLSTKG